MRKILLLLILFGVIDCAAQQKELDSLLNELKKHPQEDTVRLKLLNQISYDYETINPKLGISTAIETIESAKKQNQKKFLAVAYNRMAQNYQGTGNYDTALIYCNKSITLRKELKDTVGIAAELETIGMNYFFISDYYTAIEYQKEALALLKKINYINDQGDVLNSLGVDYEYLGNYPMALQYHQKAIDVYEQTGHKELVAFALDDISNIYTDMADYNKALQFSYKALAIYEHGNDKLDLANCYGNIGTIYDRKGDTLNSRLFLRKNLLLATQISYQYGIASALDNLGASYIKTAEYTTALPYLQAALQKFTSLNDKINEADVLSNLSTIYLKAPDDVLKKYKISSLNKFNKALQMQLKSIELSKQSHSLEKLNSGYIILSDIYAAKKNYSKAYTAYKQSVIYKDSILNDDKKQQITRLEMQYQFSKTQDSIKAINDKTQVLAKAEIQKQRIIKNSTMAGAGLLVLIGIGGFIFYKRNRDIRTQKNEAELKSQITDTEMKALRAQMNPHFIFNSLNSIADYIDKNQTQTASDFTAKFARLMRMVLENSEQKEIPLADDLKALELYMQLEQFRLKNKFDYEIKVDENIDKENTLVPPLILQPFVENSIWHGIAKKDGRGNITIYIKQQGEMINCIVEDDGGGLNAAFVNEEKRSLGTKITRERIDIINKLKKAGASMNISNREKGVRAEVRFPLELSF